MHIPDGLLPGQVCVGGYAIASLCTWYSLRRIHRQPDPQAGIPKASLFASAFFLASSIHIPIPPASVHLVLNGLLGTVLGYYAFPAILIGLLFQAVAFGHGGLSTLGINASMMGIPALLAYHLFQTRYLAQRWLGEKLATQVLAFLSGAMGVGIAAAVFFGITITTISTDLDVATERAAIYGLMQAHIPLMLLEGTFTAMVVAFLQQVKPELLKGES